MADQKIATPQTPTGNGKDRAPRQNPKAVGYLNENEEVPESQRGGFWQEELKDLMEHPNQTKLYKNVSSTVASYLKTKFGLDATTRNNKGGRADLYVTYRPDKVDQIKAEAKARAGSRKNKSKPQTPAQTPQNV
jgi:hypothetical protein